ncbi:MAG: Glu/Leu/Phe/Val dehydrogenase [Planctomycetes bacterium]|nr:Glu/Leu/Phe/Val dehydrogenase [Planctomycetota bacterium]
MNLPANKEAFYTQLHHDTLAFTRMKPVIEYTVRDTQHDVEGYVVVWNVPKGGGLAKGGTRVTPTVSLDEVKMLAQRMALKNAAAGLPLGGAKSGIRGNPQSVGFKERFCSIAQRFTCLMPEHGGPFGGLGYDIGARPEFADWFIEATGLPHRFTGKRRELGGTDYDVEGIAGLGVAVAARAALEGQGDSARGKRFAVQGLGAMGAGVIRYFAEEGGRLAGVSDPVVRGTWVLPDDLDDATHAALVDALARRDHDAARPILHAHATHDETTDSVLYLDVDVLFPCAVQDVIHKDNMDRIRAPLLSEGANGPCTPETRELLQERGVTVVPDFIANSGGIIAAHVEMTSDAADKVAEAKARTRRIVAENVTRALDLARRLEVTPYHAAHWIALRNIFDG